MRLLVDEALQDAVAHRLAKAGHDVTHVLLLRGVGDSVPERVTAILDVLPRIEYELSQGAVVAIEEDRYRVRYLPIDDT